MSAEPKQTIGDNLRAFAKQRRDAAGGPFEPNPVTCKLLQDEVARKFSARTIARQTTPPGWLAAFWVRLAFGLVALFTVATIFWTPKNSEQSTELAEKPNKVVPPRPASTPQPAPPAAGSGLGGGSPVPSEQLVLRQNDAEVGQRYGLIPRPAREPNLFLQTPAADTGPSLESKPNATATQAPLEAFTSSVDKLSKREETTADSRLTAREKAAADQLRQAKEVPLASAAANRPEAPLSFAGSGGTNVYFLSQTDVRAKYRRNFNSPPVPPVLRSFQVQQSGANVRILDADGSVYEGTASSVGNVSFRAVGTNQSVNQLVVISGELYSDTNQTAAAQNRGLSNGNLSAQAITLRGKASIGRNVKIPIEASETTR